MYGWHHKSTPLHLVFEAHSLPIYVEIDDNDMAVDDIKELKDLAKAIKKQHVLPLKSEVNFSLDGPAKTEIEFVSTVEPPDYQAFQGHMSGYAFSEPQQQKLYTLILHGVVQFDYTKPLWDQLVEAGVVVPIAAPTEAKVFTFKNISNHTLNVCGIELGPGEVWKWHSIDQHAEKWHEIQTYIKGGVLQAFDNDHADLFDDAKSIAMIGTAGGDNPPVEIKSIEDFKEHFGGFDAAVPLASAVAAITEDGAVNQLLAIESESGVVKSMPNPLAADEDWFIDKDGNKVPEDVPDTQLAAAQAVGLVSNSGKQWVTYQGQKMLAGAVKPKSMGGEKLQSQEEKAKAAKPKAYASDKKAPRPALWDGTLPADFKVMAANQHADIVQSKVQALNGPHIKKAMPKQMKKLGKSFHLNDLLGKVKMPPADLDFGEPEPGDYKRTFVISDVHGCLTELQALLERIGYQHGSDRLIFVGDLLDRGPNPLGVFRLVFGLGAEVVLGNHEEKYLRYWKHELKIKAAGLDAANMKNPVVSVTNSLEKMMMYSQLTTEDLMHIASFPTSIHIGTFDGDDFTVVHAGFEPGRHQDFQRDDKVIRVRYVDQEGMYLSGTPGKIPPGGVRWTKLWKGPHHVIYGHAVRNLVMPTVEGEKYQTIGIDTGCVMGGHLTAFELPARRFHMVRAQKKYSKVMLDNADG